MTVYALWYGGSSYSVPHVTDLETFESVDAASEALLSRYAHGHWQEQEFSFTNKSAVSDLTPAVNEQSEMQIFLAEPTEDYYPDSILSIAFDEEDNAFVVNSPV